MRKIGLVALLLAACGSEPAGITIAITADGFVKLDGKAVTLDEIRALVATAKEGLREEGHPHGGKVSALPVLLDIEDDALWRHALMVMAVLAEEKIWRVTLPGGRALPLPAYSWSAPSPEGKALLVRLLVLENGEYVVGDGVARDAESVGQWIDAQPREGILCRVAVIRAAARAPWRLVRPAFDVLRSRGVRQVDCYGAFPAEEARDASPLPMPRPAASPAGWAGFFVVDYFMPGKYEEPVEMVSEGALQPEDEIFALLDSHRAAAGLPGFAPKEALRRAASAHADEMDRLGYFGHFSPTPGIGSPSDRLAKQGWPEERRHAELLAKAETAEEAFAAILAKPENVAILADPAFKHAGVARSGDCWVVLLGAEP